MLQGQRQNFYHSKLPKPGTIGQIIGLPTVNARRKCIVIAYPLTDSPNYRFSIGIHTLFVRFLDNGAVERFSGIWFEPESGSG
ncbi:MAG: hypothetical protein ABI700_01065 [Chloroflexota bacterium]